MYWLPLLTNASHKIKVEQIEKLRQSGVSLPSVVKRVLRKYKHEFQDLFEQSDDSGDESDDERQEFKAKLVQDHMRKFDVHYFPTQNETKASTSERAILTIKQKLYRYFTDKDNYNYLPVLQDIADSYNNTYHRTITMRPADVKNNNQEEVRIATYFAQNPKGKQSSPKLKPFKLKVGNYVRISHLKTAFTRAYDQTYSGEVFRVHTRYHRGILPIYRLQDLQGDDIKGTFYESELQKVHVDTDQTWKVEKVLKRRGKGRTKNIL
ncbi:YMD3-like protein [Mya arenaria]|uniref:YMD3-like protein n=1 Tax=Mya arenaria TaxID=6604 RepID=A0ABY7EMD1_MYAAR|nr:YMD3-like protein [Mya arenaria]